VPSANLDRAETARAIVAGGAGALDKTVVSTRSSTPFGAYEPVRPS
jgi:hypothetical protein